MKTALAEGKSPELLALQEVMDGRNNGRLVLPAGYIPQNAIIAAMLILEESDYKGERLIDKVEPDSVRKALYQMLVMGLNPGKEQCALIAYKNKLRCQIMYGGWVVIAKMVDDKIADIDGEVIREGEFFEYDKVNKLVINHTMTSDISPVIKAAYPIITYKNGSIKVPFVMSYEDILKSWEMSRTWKDGHIVPKNFDSKGNLTSEVHRKFGEQMCIKTVISRVSKMIRRKSNDSTLMAQVVNEVELFNETKNTQEEIKELANKGQVIAIEEESEQKTEEECTLQDAVEAINDCEEVSVLETVWKELSKHFKDNKKARNELNLAAKNRKTYLQELAAQVEKNESEDAQVEVQEDSQEDSQARLPWE